MNYIKLFLIFLSLSVVSYSQNLPHQSLDTSKNVFALDLQGSLKQYSSILETLQLQNFNLVHELIQSTDQIIYIELDQQNLYNIWIQHQDDDLTFESKWIKLLSQFWGKSSPTFISGKKYWEFKDAPKVFVNYQSHEIRIIEKFSKKTREKSSNFYWKNHVTPFMQKQYQKKFPVLSLWSDLSGLIESKNSTIYKILKFFGLESLSSYQTLGIQDDFLYYAHKMPIEKGKSFIINPIIPSKSVQWHYPNLFPHEPDIYLELTSSDYSNLLNQIRNIVYLWGDRPGKEFDSDLLIYEEKYDLSIKDDVLRILKDGASVGVFQPNNIALKNNDFLWSSTLKLTNKQLLLNLIEQFPQKNIQIHQNKGSNLHFAVIYKKKAIHIYWKDEQLYLSNELGLIRKMVSLKETGNTECFELPKKVKSFKYKPSGFGHRLFLSEAFMLKYIEETVNKELEKIKFFPSSFLDTFRPVVINWFKQQKYWSFFQLNYERNYVHLDMWVDRNVTPSTSRLSEPLESNRKTSPLK